MQRGQNATSVRINIGFHLLVQRPPNAADSDLILFVDTQADLYAWFCEGIIYKAVRSLHGPSSPVMHFR